MVGELFGVDNTLVYAKGTMANPVISKVVEIDLDNETEIDIVRSYVYEQESGNGYKSNYSADDIIANLYEEELVREYRRENFSDYQELKRQRANSKRNEGIDRGQQDRRRDTGKDKSNVTDTNDVRFSMSDDPYKYTKQSAKVITEQLIANDIFGNPTLYKKQDFIDLLYTALNTANKDEREQLLNKCADYIINKTFVDDVVEMQHRNGEPTITQLRTAIAEIYTQEQLAEIKRQLLNEFDRLSRVEGQAKADRNAEKFKKEISKMAEKQQYLIEYNKSANKLLYQLTRMDDKKQRKFMKASEYKADIFKKSIESLAKIKYRGDMNQASTRKIVAGLRDWYNKNNPLLVDCYDEEIAFLLDEVAKGEGGLKLIDIQYLTRLVQYFNFFIENYNKYYEKGKYIDAEPLAKKYVKLLNENAKEDKTQDKNGEPEKETIIKRIKKLPLKYLETFGDPASLFRLMDSYQDGFYTEMFDSLREGAEGTAIAIMDMNARMDEFKKKYKNYFKQAEDVRVEYNGTKIPLLDALYLYVSMGDSGSHRAYAFTGFTLKINGKAVRVNPLINKADYVGYYTDEELLEIGKNAVVKARANLNKEFSNTDKELIKIAQMMFNVECRERYDRTNKALKGYSNIVDGEYCPLHRAYVSKEGIDWEKGSESDLMNSSFSKDRVPSSTAELLVEPIDVVLDRHIRGVALYESLAPVTEKYKILYNLDVRDENSPKLKSIKTESENVWAEGNRYIKELVNSIKGEPASKGVGTKLFSTVRKAYAQAQLGGNVKVLFSQMMSLVASSGKLQVGSIVKGIGVQGVLSTDDVDKYCDLARLRNYDNAVAKAQGVLDNISKVGEIFMKPIGAVDRFVIRWLYGSCQIEVEKKFGLKVGTEENKIKAGEMLAMVIRETQQNSLATERSAAMRSGSEFMKGVTAFSADAMKVQARVIDCIGRQTALQERLKKANTDEERQALQKEIKQAKTETAKSITALFVQAVLMAGIAKLFKWFYKKEEKDDEVVENMVFDAIGNLMGGLPLIRDIYTYFTDGYELKGQTYSMINDLLKSAGEMRDLAGKIFEGEYDEQDIGKALRSLCYSTGQVTGIPVRNLYNLVYGFVSFDSSTKYAIDSLFYTQNYKSDIEEAVKNNNERLAKTVLDKMMNQKQLEMLPSLERETLRLVKKGYTILPNSIPKSVTVDDKKITLTKSQREQFSREYSKVIKEADRIIVSNFYRAFDPKQRAECLDRLYDTYYNMVQEKVLGLEKSDTTLVATAITPAVSAIFVNWFKYVVANKDKYGNVVKGSKKEKVRDYIVHLPLTTAQKWLLMGYCGYEDDMQGELVRKYVKSLAITQSERERLLEKCNY